MIELDGLDAAALEALLDDLAMKNRHVAFSGSRVRNRGGQMGTIQTPLGFGPVFQGREIATLGAPYAMPGESTGQACCPHFANGAIEEGAQDVVFQGRPVVMMGHRGTHWPSCKGERAPAVVVEGWRIAYMAARQFDLG